MISMLPFNCVKINLMVCNRKNIYAKNIVVINDY